MGELTGGRVQIRRKNGKYHGSYSQQSDEGSRRNKEKIEHHQSKSDRREIKGTWSCSKKISKAKIL